MTTMSLHKSAEWKPGLRSYFEYRDLGIVAATKGKVLAHVIRAREPCRGPGGYHTHDLEFQMNYVLRGWIRVDFEAGDSWHQEPNIKHEVLEFSDDFEVIEICGRDTGRTFASFVFALGQRVRLTVAPTCKFTRLLRGRFCVLLDPFLVDLQLDVCFTRLIMGRNAKPPTV